MVTGESSGPGVKLLKSLLSWQHKTLCLAWLCDPGVQLSGVVGADGCLITNPDLAAHPRWTPKVLSLQTFPPVLVEHKECFHGPCPWRVGLALGPVHRRPLQVGIGQAVFLQPEQQPVSVLCWSSFPNLQIRLNTSENTIKT